MKYPKFLSANGNIGYVAPSFGAATEPYKSAFLNALDKFEKLGHGAVLGENVFKCDGIGISSSPESCGRELTEAYCDGRSDILLSCGGGELMCETISHVDFQKIREAEPKWYMGYSDNTNFTFLLTTLCDTASVYAPCAPSFGMEPWHKALFDAYEILKGERNFVEGYDMWERESLKDANNPLVPYNTTERRISRQFGCDDEEIDFSGRLIGGCVDCLITLLGTKFDRVSEFLERYKEDGFVWFLECCDLNVFSMRRAMWQMKNAGWFKYAKGFLIGRPMNFYGGFMGLDRYSAIMGQLEELGVPVITDLDIGHLPPMMPLVCGSLAQVKYSGNDIRITMNYK